MNPLLISAADSVLLIVDVQDKLLALIPDNQRLLWNLRRLAQGAKVVEVPRLATEQYPEKLGSTNSTLQPYVTNTPVPGKLTFSCTRSAEFALQLRETKRRQVVVAGLESHVCVLQTSLDLLADGFDVFVVVDAIGARHEIDSRVACRRMESAGVTLVTTESALFEWSGRAGTPTFKEISQIVRSEP